MTKKKLPLGSSLDVAFRMPETVLESVQYYFEASKEQKKDIYIVTMGYEKVRPDFVIKRKAYPFYNIEVVIKGCLLLKVGNKPFLPMVPGTIAGYPAGVSYQYKGDGEETIEHYYIAFLGQNAGELFQQSSLDRKPVFKLSNQLNGEYLVKTMFEKATEKSLYYHELCCHYLKALLLEQTDDNSIKDVIPRSLSTYQTCKKYIDENFSHRISVADVAKHCDVNDKYMARLFKKHIGMPPNQYIMRLKLNKASHLLLETSTPSHEVAYMVGFEDPYHFSKTFKKFYGMSPNNYRHKCQGEQATNDNKENL